MNTTFDLSFPLGQYGNLYNFSYPAQSNAGYFNNSVFYKVGGEVGFIRDMEIQGFKSYNVEELLSKNKPYTYLNMSEIGMKISPGK